MASANRPVIHSPASMAEMPIPPGKKAEDYLIAYKGMPYRAINAISQDVANIELKLYRKRMKRGKQDIEQIFEHESLSLLYHVNDFATFYDLIEANTTFGETSGEAFWLFVKDALGRPCEIWVLRPDWVTILPDKKKVIKGYQFRPGGAFTDQIVFPPEDIMHFKYFNPRKQSRGKGSTQAAAMEIDLDDFAANWSRNFFFNSAIPSILFKFKKKLDPEQLEMFMRQWEAKMRGVNQAHKIAAISGDVETEPLGADMNKMNLVEQREFNRSQILSIYQVPKSIVAISDDVNRANAHATIAAYMERTIDPKMRKLVAHLNEFYLKRFWPNEELFFDYTNPVPQDREQQLKVYESGLKYGWLTINEVREEENKIPVEGGDSIYLPFNLTPIGQATEKIKSLFGRGSKDVLALEKKKRKQETKTHMHIPPKSLMKIRKMKDKNKLKLKITKMLSHAIRISEDELKRESVWRALIAKTDVWEEVLGERVKKLFAEQESMVFANIEQRKSFGTYKADLGQFLFDLASENEKWQNEMEPLLREVIKTQGRDTLNFLGLALDFDITQENVIKYLSEEAGGLIKGINEFTLKKLRGELAEGVKEEEGIDDLKSRVSGVFGESALKRAEKIARTEVLRASNFATDEAYKQSGIVKGKEWLTALDERVCPICEPLDGKKTSKKGLFSTSVGEVPYPPAHPNCRCTLIPVILERETSVKSPIEKQAREKKQQKEEMKQVRKEVMVKAKTKAKEIVKEAKEKAKKEVEKIKVDTEKEIETLIKKAKTETKKERRSILGELKELREKAREVISGSRSE